MFRSYRIGSLFGFPIDVNLSFLFLLGFALLWWGGITGVFLVLIAFASVLLHELGHALMARHLGVTIAGIELYFFGGAAKMTSQPKTANDEVAIAAAGPAVSFALGGLGVVLGALTGFTFFQYLGWINIIIGTFNLIPALPMDGGRILRALLTRKMSFMRATRTSVMIARGFAILMGVYGLFTLQFFLVLLAGLLWFMGSAELRMAEVMDSHFGYDQNGYRFRASEVYNSPWDMFSAEQYSRTNQGVEPEHHPFFSIHRPVRSSGFVIRHRNGRLYVDWIR
jgi:Zn-dependent protease